VVQVVEARKGNVTDSVESGNRVNQSFGRGTDIELTVLEGSTLKENRTPPTGTGLRRCYIFHAGLTSLNCQVQAEDECRFVKVPLLLCLEDSLILVVSYNSREASASSPETARTRSSKILNYTTFQNP
jgi:hypothetical protein